MEDLLNYTSLNKRRIENICSLVNKLESKYSSLSDYELSKMTDRFRFYLRDGKTIDDIMPDALAVCKEAIKRKIGLVPYDTQVIAAASMSDNIIAQMATGEGKTLVQILSSYLYALEATKDADKSKWGSVHILTANEYLAQRDKVQNEAVFNLLGLSCGYVEDKSNSDKPDYLKKKQKAYSQDIVYATAKTVAFDYLDDNQAFDIRNKYINRELYHAIVDEADDILLDQAVTPLILSGTMPGLDIVGTIDLANYACNFVNGVKGYRNRPVTCTLADQFKKNIDTKFGDSIIFKDTLRTFLSDDLLREIYGDKDISHDISLQEELFNKESAITNAVLAKYYYKRNKQYILREIGKAIDTDGKVKKVFEVALVSEATGRVMPKTKYRNGMQEAIEAEEAFLADGKYIIKRSTKNIEKSTITYPEFVRLYKTGISGMTGTSDIEDFKDIYGLETYEVEPRIPSARKDEETELYSKKEYKYEAIVRDIYERHKKQQPILVGTISINESDELCSYLDRYKIPYQRLDAINHKDEALKIANAGKKGMITIATNMAGRGTDIKFEKGVEELGGLYVIGVSKNNNRRIDRQLMGRCARQGQPGVTKYYQSLEDELVLTRYGKVKLIAFKKYYEDQRTKITNRRVIDMVDKCQIAEEGISKQIRRIENQIHLKVFSVHRDKVFEQRNKILGANYKELLNIIVGIIKEYSITLVEDPTEVDKVRHLIDIDSCYDEDNLKYRNNIMSALFNKFKASKSNMDPKKYLEYIRSRLLDIIDSYWVSHLMYLEDMKSSIMNAGSFGIDTLTRFERDANKLFVSMNNNIRNEMLTYSINPYLEFGSYVINNSIRGDIGHEITY